MIRPIYDKNGCGNPDIYCWTCSGKKDDTIAYFRAGEPRGKPTGRMIPVPTTQPHRTGNITYECEDCGYHTNYDRPYIKEWKIHDIR